MPRISNLPAAGAIVGTEELAVVQAGQTVKAQPKTIRQQLNGSPVTVASSPVTAAYIIVSHTGEATLTLPTATAGATMTIKTVTENGAISASANVVPIDDTTAGTFILPSSLPGAWVHLVGNGTNWVVMAQG